MASGEAGKVHAGPGGPREKDRQREEEAMSSDLQDFGIALLFGRLVGGRSESDEPAFFSGDDEEEQEEEEVDLDSDWAETEPTAEPRWSRPFVFFMAWVAIGLVFTALPTIIKLVLGMG